MEGCPLFYEAARPWGKPTFRYDSEVYIYHGFMFTVSGVEVWRVVVADVDSDGNAVEPTEFRHDDRETTGPYLA